MYIVDLAKSKKKKQNKKQIKDTLWIYIFCLFESCTFHLRVGANVELRQKIEDNVIIVILCDFHSKTKIESLHYS